MPARFGNACRAATPKSARTPLKNGRGNIFESTTVDLNMMIALWFWTDGVDTVIAASATDAVSCWVEHYGESYGARHGLSADKDPMACWARVNGAPEDTLTVVSDPRGASSASTMTRREWIGQCGRGWFSSNEY